MFVSLWRSVAPCGGLWRRVGRESWALKKDCSNPRLQYPKLGDLNAVGLEAGIDWSHCS